MKSSSDESSDYNLTLLEVQKEGDFVVESLLPQKSKEKYQVAYDKFMQWNTDRKSKSLSESVFLAYFRELSKKMKPSSLWNLYSILKCTVLLNHNLNIKNYRNLSLMLKKQSDGYKSKTSEVLTEQNVEKFLNEAPDSHYLAVKVVLIFGIHGACRCNEIASITLNDIESHDNAMTITLRDSDTKIDRTFVIRDSSLALVHKYISLRPVDIKTNRFFLRYNKSNCTKQVIGRHKIAGMPKIIATYLNLPDPELYTGHCFRRSSAAMLAATAAKQITLNYGVRKTDKMAEIYIEDIEESVEEVDDKSNITLKMSPKEAFTPTQEPGQSSAGLSPISNEKMIQISNSALDLFENASATDDGPSTATTSAQTHQNVADAKKHGGRGKKRKVEPVYESSESSDDSLASDYSEGAQPRALGAAPTLCCCCLSGAGVAGLADAGPDGAAPAHSLAYCFDINYPLELRAASSICRECVAKLHDGVQFKRRALECLSILTDYRETGEMQAEGSQPPDARETYNIVCEEDNTVTVKQEPLDADDTVEVPIDATVSEFEKIQQEYDLTTGNDEFLSTPDDHEPVDANQHMNTPIFTETPVTEEDIQNFAKQTPEDVKFFKDGCKCEKNCHKLFSKYEILEFRKECEKYRTDYECKTKHLDIFLTGALACIAGRAIPKQEVKLQFRDIPVCQEFFMYIFALNQQQFDVILTKILDRTAYQWSHKHIIDQHFAINFLKDYSTQHSLVLPGRFSNKHPDLHILPRNVTKTTVYSEYAKACVVMKKKCINQITWDRLWERLCPYIVRKVPSDLCKVCRDNNKRLAAAAASGSGEPAVLQQQLRHLRLAGDAAALRLRAGGEGGVQCGVDWLRPLRLRAGGAALLAVARPPPLGAVVYVAPERVAGGGGGANLLLSLLHHFLRAGADVQCHCGPLLRADRVLQYAAWRGRAARCGLAFLPPGHDIALHAPCLALLEVALRDRPAQSVEDICEILSGMNVTPIAVATEQGDLNIPIYDWLAYFDARNPVPVKNIENYCYFEANSDNIGAIKCKVSAESDKADVMKVFNGISLTGSPQILPLEPSKQIPIEIPITSGERQKKVTEKVPHVEENEVLIEFCPNDAQDPLELVKEEVEMDFEDHEVS